MNKLKNSCGALILPALFAFDATAMQRNAGWDADDQYDQASAQSYSQEEWQQQCIADQKQPKRKLRGPGRTAPQVKEVFVEGIVSVTHEVTETTSDVVTIKKVVLLEARNRHGREESVEFPVEKIPAYMPKECWQDLNKGYQEHEQQCKEGVEKTVRVMEAAPEKYKRISFAFERIVHDGVLCDQVTFEATATKEVIATWREDEGERNLSEQEFNALLSNVNEDLGNLGVAGSACGEQLCHPNLVRPTIGLPGSRQQDF